MSWLFASKKSETNAFLYSPNGLQIELHLENKTVCVIRRNPICLDVWFCIVASSFFHSLHCSHFVHRISLLYFTHSSNMSVCGRPPLNFISIIHFLTSTTSASSLLLLMYCMLRLFVRSVSRSLTHSLSFTESHPFQHLFNKKKQKMTTTTA